MQNMGRMRLHGLFPVSMRCILRAIIGLGDRHGCREEAAQRTRFVAWDDPSVKVFDVKPGASFERELRDHMRSDGRPDMWDWHLNTKPPLDGPAPVLIATGIDVPERLRSTVGRAPCPLCSLPRGNYFRGVLTWWQQEQALRVIGHECAERYFGTGIFERLKVEKQANADFDYLVLRLPLVRSLLAIMEGMVDTAVALDRLRHRTLKGMSKRLAKRLHKYISPRGELVIFEDRQMASPDAHGNVAYELVSVPVARFPCAGWRMLSPPSETASAMLCRAGQNLKGLDLFTDDEILDATSAWNATRMNEARAALIEAARNVKEGTGFAQTRKPFLLRTTLGTSWTGPSIIGRRSTSILAATTTGGRCWHMDIIALQYPRKLRSYSLPCRTSRS